MEENYKLEKEYKVPAALFSEAYLAFQKKYIYPKSCMTVNLSSVMRVMIEKFSYLKKTY